MGLSATHLLLLATALPLVSFLVLIFLGGKIGKGAGYVGTAAIAGALGLSVMALVTWHAKASAATGAEGGSIEVTSYRWIELPAANPAKNADMFRGARATEGIAAGTLVDSLTLVMFLLVTTVALMVHVFSMAYMSDDERYSRFFAYLGLFCFSMMGLLISNNLVQLFVFWELVGICSYLLIGFWFEKRGPANAGRKAVVVNRIGDAMFLLGLGLLVMQLGAGALTLYDGDAHFVLGEKIKDVMGGDANGFLTQVEYLKGYGSGWMGLSWLTWAGILMFGGAAAKSAQFPLHVWLADAMEGPTPVSALIHAATMVAAGVYLVARLFPILTVDVRMVIAVIGCVTLAMGALIAMVQTDLKKVLAFSTVSQLGYMMLFLGSGGYVAGMFHLVTHGFFKACLFLGAGAVISAMHHEQDMRKMGGLWRKLPITALTFLIAVAAIAGTPLLSGYYSKDLGLASVYMYTQQLGGGTTAMLLFWVPVAVSYLTGFYMMRAWWMTFAGKPRDEEAVEKARESTTMNLPLLVLAALSVVSGSLGILQAIIAKSAPKFLPLQIYGEGSLIGYFTNDTAVPTQQFEHAMETVHSVVLWACVVGPVVAVLLYWNGLGLAEKIRKLPGVSAVNAWLRERMYFDYFYEGTVVALTRALSFAAAMFDRFVVDGTVRLVGAIVWALGKLSRVVDDNVVDGAVRGTAKLTQAGGKAVLSPQTGRIRVYVLSMMTVVGIVAAILAVVFVMRA